jgi:6-phosphogluconolactonase
MNLNVSKDREELNRHVAGWLTAYVAETLSKQPRFTIVLSGGSTPKKLYQLLASQIYRDNIDWTKLHVFWGDERYVPFHDDRNNAKMAFESLLNHVPVPREQIYIMQTDSDPDTSADAYESILHRYFTHRKYSFDLLLLGLGDNAHTLSLFPGYSVIHEKEKWVKAFYLKEQESYRITLTVPVVNKSARIAFLVSGSDKAASVQNVLYGQHDPELYPAQVIQPYNGELYWFIDKAAAADIQ